MDNRGDRLGIYFFLVFSAKFSTLDSLRLLVLVSVFFIIGIGCFSSFCGSVLNISVMSALADIADEHALATGKTGRYLLFGTYFLRRL